MKKLLALAMAAVLLVSCSDDDAPSIDMSLLKGRKWYNSSTSYGDHVNNCATAKDYIRFSSDSDAYERVYNHVDCVVYDYGSSYIIEDMTVTRVDSSGGTTHSIIKELTPHKLVFRDYYDGNDDGGNDFVITSEYTSE